MGWAPPDPSTLNRPRQPDEPRKGWVRRHKVVSLLGAVGVVIVGLGALGAALGSGDDGETNLRTVAAPATEAVATTVRPPTTEAPGTTGPTTTAGVERPPSQTLPVPTAPTTVLVMTVGNVVDGHTFQISTGEKVRLIGVGAPPWGCAEEARQTLARLLKESGQPVTLTAGPAGDKDPAGRLLRYADVAGQDVGLSLIQQGLAVARYDSRDGSGAHPREAAYIEADAAAPDNCPSVGATPAPTPTPAPAPVPGPAPTPAPGGNVYYANCDAVRAAGAAPLYAGQPGYRPNLDRDGDGVACE